MAVERVKMSGRLARVAWKIVETGFQGHGDYLTYDLAQAWVKYGNEMYGRNWHLRTEARGGRREEDNGQVIEHWLELHTESANYAKHDSEESSAP